MTAIQIILLLGILFLFLYFLLNLRKRFAELLFFSMITIGAIFFIIAPDTSTLLAKKLGVQRGVDLIFYFTILFFSYLLMKLYLKIRRIETQLTSMIREEALLNAKLPNTSKS